MSVDCPEGVVSVQDPVRLQNKPLAGSPSFLEKAFNCHVRSVIYLGGSRPFTKKYSQPVALRVTIRPKFDAFKHLGSLLGVGVTVRTRCSTSSILPLLHILHVPCMLEASPHELSISGSGGTQLCTST